jgi:hypothetical protein
LNPLLMLALAGGVTVSVLRDAQASDLVLWLQGFRRRSRGEASGPPVIA